MKVSQKNIPVVDIHADNVIQYWPALTLAIRSSTFIALDLVRTCTTLMETLFIWYINTSGIIMMIIIIINVIIIIIIIIIIVIIITIIIVLIITIINSNKNSNNNNNNDNDELINDDRDDDGIFRMFSFKIIHFKMIC